MPDDLPAMNEFEGELDVFLVWFAATMTPLTRRTVWADGSKASQSVCSVQTTVKQTSGRAFERCPCSLTQYRILPKVIWSRRCLTVCKPKHKVASFVYMRMGMLLYPSFPQHDLLSKHKTVEEDRTDSPQNIETLEDTIELLRHVHKPRGFNHCRVRIAVCRPAELLRQWCSARIVWNSSYLSYFTLFQNPEINPPRDIFSERI